MPSFCFLPMVRRSAAEEWELLHQARFGEGVYATPALVDGRIYLRTAGHLYCFGRKPDLEMPLKAPRHPSTQTGGGLRSTKPR